MLGEEKFHGEAGGVVESFERAVKKAQTRVSEAEVELRAASAALDVAERERDAALRVYYSAMSDRRLPRVTAEKQEWLKALARFSVIGTAEMNAAAQEIGWNPKPTALRAIKKQYVGAGYFNDIGRGAVSLNRARISLGVGSDLFLDEDRLEEPPAAGSMRVGDAEDDALDMPSPEETASRNRSAGFDFLDDDTPF